MRRYGVPLEPPLAEALWMYHRLLRRHNADRDLTRLIGFETIVQRHYADCLVVDRLLRGRWPSPLADIGSGAGFPGLMIKLASPLTHVILAEPRPRRVAFLETAIRELGLEDIEVFGHKVTSKSFTVPVKGAVTRAFESIARTLPRLGGSLVVGGRAYFMKGPGVDAELQEARDPDYRLLEDKAYRIPNTTLDRRLIVYERIR